MKKTKLLTGLATLAGLTTIVPLTTLISCNKDNKEEKKEKIVTLDHINLSLDTKSVFQAGKLPDSNESEEEVEPTL
ncbi:MAG: hypothetical protein MJ200_00845 [Mycoplasmoidaceae bacterium]|nr:hypothetical protein [Mycoplasmoidaceae bacterium]